MRILLLSQNYPPEASSAAQKVSEMAEFMAQNGHTVTVVTAFPNYPSGVVFEGYRRTWRTEERIGTTKLVRSWLHVTKERHRFVPRLLSYVTFAATALVNSLGLGRQDVIYVYAPPTFLVPTAQVLAKILRAALVVDVHDLWPDAPIHLGYVKHPLAVAAARGFERWTYAAPDKLLFYSETHRQKVIAKGAPASKTAIVPLWIDTQKFHPLTGDAPAALRAAHGLTGHFVVTYTGNLGIPQGLDVLLEAADLLAQRGDTRVKFALVGGGAQRDQLVALAEKLKLTNVVFVPPQPVTAMNVWMAASDLLMLHLDAAPFREGTVPGKLFFYMASGRAVLAAALGETEVLVRAHDCGVPIAPRDSVAMAAAIAALAADPERSARLGRNGRAAAEAHFDRAKVLQLMERELVSAAK